MGLPSTQLVMLVPGVTADTSTHFFITAKARFHPEYALTPLLFSPSAAILSGPLPAVLSPGLYTSTATS